MKTCKGLKAKHFFTKVILLLTISSSSLKQQLVSASHLHSSTNYADASLSTDASVPTPPQQQAHNTIPNADSTAVSSPPTNNKKYSYFSTTCDQKLMTITGHFNDVFRGRIYAVGYPDELECGVTTAGLESSENITLTLPLGQCGIQMRGVDDNLENDLLHDVAIYIQYSAYLQQVIDEKVSLTCTQEKPKPSTEDPLTESSDKPTRSSRQGRRMKDSGPKATLPKISNKIGEGWMEIFGGKDPTPKSKKHTPIAVGQDVILVVSTKVNRGYDARVVNCTAHDGSRTGNDGFRAQQLLDSAGCSVDRGLVPNFRRRRLPVETSRVSTLHFATFPAFKFPERDHLHIKCTVAYCQGPCPQEACDSGRNHFGTWREKYGRISEVLIDTSDVFNSLEIMAPELEDTGGHHYERHQSGAVPTPESTSATATTTNTNSNNNHLGNSRQFSDSQQLFYTSGNSLNGPQSPWPNGQMPQMNGNTVCISPGTVILALVILGIVLVISATATLWFALKRSELKKLQMKHFQHNPSPYYRFSQHW